MWRSRSSRRAGPTRRSPTRPEAPLDRADFATLGGRRSAMSRRVEAEAVLAALQPIVDPDFGKSIVDLGFVKELRVEGARVSFAIELTTPACPVKAEFEREARERVAAL